jgi:hypothetical protein
MRQPINLEQTELDELAERADGLSDWLEEKAMHIATRIVIPSELAAVGSIIMATGLVLLVDDAIPDSICWAGCSYPR